jgi:hypothetical protein
MRGRVDITGVESLGRRRSDPTRADADEAKSTSKRTFKDFDCLRLTWLRLGSVWVGFVAPGLGLLVE